jgi:redox-sensing transcriptional repressor
MRVGNLPGIRRLPIYLDILRGLRRNGVKTVSTPMIAEAAGLVVPVVRKDIEMTGATGKTGVGFVVDALIADIEAFLGWDNPRAAFLAGVGHLGSALLGYDGFRNYGLYFVAAFDVDVDVIGRSVHGIEVFPPEKAVAMARRLHISTGVITVPSVRAQEVADLFVIAGITRIWSFASAILNVPDEVTVQREDLAAGLAELLVRSARRAALPYSDSG